MQGNLPVADGGLRQIIGKIIPHPDNDKPNPADVDDFMNLKVLYQPLFNIENLHEIYDLYYLIEERGTRFVYDWLVNEIIPKKEELIDGGNVEHYSLMIFESPALDILKQRESAALALQSYRGTLTDTRECGKCGSKQMYLEILQDRKADEGPSSVFTCPKCNASWKEG